jgi:hypothetical protein
MHGQNLNVAGWEAVDNPEVLYGVQYCLYILPENNQTRRCTTLDTIDSGISLTSTIREKGVSQGISKTGVHGMSPASILPRLKPFRYAVHGVSPR